jgi:hypothetical protein
MELSTAISMLGLVAAILFPLLARRDLLTKLAAQDQGREEWRADVGKRLSSLEDRKQSIDFAAMQAMDKERERAWWDWRRDAEARLQRVGDAPYRIEQLEKQHDEYRDWKHEKVDPYIGDYAALERRVTRIETKMNGLLK